MKKTLVLLAAGLFLSSALIGINLTQNVKAENFGSDIHASPGYGRKPDIALDNSDNIYLAWNAVKFAKSIDSGETFSDPLDISDGYVPSIAVDDSNNIHVAVGDKGNIYYTKSTDGGETFSDPVVISDSPGGDNPDIATFEDNVYIVWTASYLENLSLDKSIDGNGFGTDVRVNGPEDRPADPAIAIGSDETIYVAFENGLGFGDADIRVVTSTDQGSTFDPSVAIEDPDNNMYAPSIAALGTDKVYVSYWSQGINRVRCSRSTNSADSFSTPVNVSHNSGATLAGGHVGDIKVHPCGKIFVTWHDDSSGEDAVYFANSTDGGTTFGENFKVNDGSEAAYHPKIAVGSDTQTYIVWADSRDDGNLFFDKAADATWPSQVTDLQATQKTNTSVTLSWTAPGDNFDLESVSSYDIRYSTSSITESNWNDATLVSETIVIDEAGSTESINITGLDKGTDYYFALKASDEVPNTSPVSNV
ncbi:MAG: fibronectin type III domain-containing protein, partial [Candidatus Thermoplasmatota archaeon]|nr:fibronectin type III domain-containing protein [Candidatus Thermoplasmatota archaeon]